MDALRVEFPASHMRGLILAIDDLGAALDKALRKKSAAYDALPAREQESRGRRAGEREEEVHRGAYHVRLVATIRSQVPAGSEDATPDEISDQADRSRLVVVGPAPFVRELIARATVSVASALRDAASDVIAAERDEGRGASFGSAARNAPSRLHLQEVAAAAHAFGETLANLLALESYTFDPAYTPIRVDEVDPR